MPKVNLSLEEVGCRKPNCKHRLEVTARHHRRCETMFIRAFGKTLVKKATKKYGSLVQRYASFNSQDWVRICDWHHCEIHLIYDEIIRDDKLGLLKMTLVDYTWKEANALMNKLKAECLEWEKEVTRGVDPEKCAPGKRFPKYKGTHRKKSPRRKRRKKKFANRK